MQSPYYERVEAIGNHVTLEHSRALKNNNGISKSHCNARAHSGYYVVQ